MKKLNKDNKGFSLVELLVVIAIMVVLVGVLAPSLLSNIEKTRESKDIQALDTLAGNIQACMTDEKVYDVITDSTTDVEFDLFTAYKGTGAFASTNMATALDSYLALTAVYKSATESDIKLFEGKIAKNDGKKIDVVINHETGSITVKLLKADGTTVTGKSGTEYSVTR